MSKANDFQKKSTPEVTVVIVAYKSLTTIGQTLDALKDSNESGLVDIVIVDNASNDGTLNYLKRNHPSIKLIESNKNIGFGRGCNLGMEVATTPYVLLLNPDAVIDTKSMSILINFMNENPKAGICGPAVIEPTGKLQQAGNLPNPWKVMLKPLLPQLVSRGQRIVEPKESPLKTDWICGSVMLIRMDMINQIGLFDPAIFLYFEETDLHYRAQKAGWEIWTVGKAICTHVNAASAKLTNEKMSGGTISEHYYRSRFYYMAKHFSYPVAIFAEAGELVFMFFRGLVNLLRRKSNRSIRLRFCSPIFKLPKFPE